MPEQKILNTETEIQISGSTLGIYTYYTNKLQDIIAFISSSIQNINSILFAEGELGYKKSGYSDVSFFLNNNGDMIVMADDADKFSINGDGQLTITE